MCIRRLNKLRYVSQDTKMTSNHPTRIMLLGWAAGMWKPNIRPQNNIHKETVCIMHTAIMLVLPLLTIRRVKR